MLPVYRSYTAPNTSNPDPIVLDWMQSVPNTTVGVYIVSGTATFGVQYTLDDVNSTTQTPRWFDDTTLPKGTTTSGVTYFGFPIRAVRLYLSVCAGTVELKVIQPPNI